MDEPLTVLVVDDDPGHRSLIRRNLVRAGLAAEIREFAGGEEVLAWLRDAPDGRYAMLLDVRMPRVDGLEVLGTIKTDPRLQPMPVLMLTTTDDPTEVRRAAELGCNLYLTKAHGYQAFGETMALVAGLLSRVQVPVVVSR